MGRGMDLCSVSGVSRHMVSSFCSSLGAHCTIGPQTTKRPALRLCSRTDNERGQGYTDAFGPPSARRGPSQAGGRSRLVLEAHVLVSVVP